MRIRPDIVEEIVSHAREEAPNECCGMIGARDGEATSLYRARNAEASPLRYTVHPQDQLRIMEQIDERGETDVNLAENWPDPLYVICSVADPDSPHLRAFAIRDGDVEEAELRVE